MPIDLAATVEKLSLMLDQDYSKLYRRGFDLVVIEVFKGGRIDRKTYDEYRTVRHLFKDEEFGGIPDLPHDPDLDREPTEEEWLSARPVRAD